MMLRFVLIVQIIGAHAAFATPTDAPASRIVDVDDLPPFVSPLRLNTEQSLPEGGEIKEENGFVCYDHAAHSRLLLFMHNTEPASDLRALQTWNEAYAIGYEDGANRAVRLVEQSRPSLFSEIMSSRVFWLSVGIASSITLMEFIK